MGQDVRVRFPPQSIPLNLYSPVLVGDDNPAFEGVFEFSSISAGGSIGALLSLRCGCRRNIPPSLPASRCLLLAAAERDLHASTELP